MTSVLLLKMGEKENFLNRYFPFPQVTLQDLQEQTNCCYAVSYHHL
jgi:hypothetical protein